MTPFHQNKTVMYVVLLKISEWFSIWTTLIQIVTQRPLCARDHCYVLDASIIIVWFQVIRTAQLTSAKRGMYWLAQLESSGSDFSLSSALLSLCWLFWKRALFLVIGWPLDCYRIVPRAMSRNNLYVQIHKERSDNLCPSFPIWWVLNSLWLD